MRLARRLDPAGEKALGMAKRMRRQALSEGGRHEPERVEETAQQHFGLRHRRSTTGDSHGRSAPGGELGGELFLEDTLGELGIGLPLRRAHHLPQEKRHQLRFTILVTATSGACAPGRLVTHPDTTLLSPT